MRTLYTRKMAWFLAVLIMAPIATVMAQAQQEQPEKTVPEDRVKLELYSDGIQLIHQNKYFYAPYTVRAGDTFGSLSEKFYETRKYTVTLSEVNGMSPTEPLQPGSNIYITSGSVILLFALGQEQAQSEKVREYLSTVKDPAQLTYVWDEATVNFEMSHEGKWLLTQYDTGKLRIFDPVTQKPELQLAFKKAPLLQILFLSKPYVTGVKIKP